MADMDDVAEQRGDKQAQRSLLPHALGAALVAFLAAWFCAALVNLSEPCGGDGGSPYAQAGSPADHFCNSGGQVALWLIPITSVIVGLFLASRRRSAWWV